MTLSTITFDLLCCRCGYNLRTRAPSDLCPECALPVDTSIRFHQAQPSLAFGAKRLAFGCYLIAANGVFTGLASTYFLLLPHLLARVGGTPYYNIPLGLLYLWDTLWSLTTYLVIASAGLAPPILRVGQPHNVLFNLAIAAAVLVAFALTGMIFLQYPLGVRLTQQTAEIRYGLHAAACVLNLVLQAYVLVYLLALTRRPEFAGLRTAVVLIMSAGFVWSLWNLAVNLYMIRAVVLLRAPPAGFTAVTRTADWLRLIPHLGTIAVWFALARRAARAAAGPRV